MDRSLRLCVDYKALNNIMVKNKDLVPNTDELFDWLGGARIFSKLDLRSGYHQVQIKAKDELKTIRIMQYGSYKFIMMPFGLTNAPATFCALVNHVFHAFLDKFIVVYLDDILVFSKSLEEHVKRLWQVFEMLRTHQLYLNSAKCAFGIEEVDFLGHVVGHK